MAAHLYKVANGAQALTVNLPGLVGNHDGYQFYCAMNTAEMSLTKLGAVGSNKEGDEIHIDLHRPSCDVVKNYSGKYLLLMQ